MENISIVGPESAVTAIPRILGFSPRRSLVLLWVLDGAVVVAQRTDLPAADMSDWASHVVGVARRVDADAALDIWVDDHVPSPALVRQVHRACAMRGRRVLATLATDGQAWIRQGLPWQEARELPDELRWRAPRREDFSVAPDVDRPLIGAVRALEGPAAAAVIADLVDPARSESGGWSRAEARRVVSALQEVRVRDRVLWHVCTSPQVARTVAMRLVQLLRRVHPGSTGQVAITAAMAFWVAGDGYRASVVLERAGADNPDEPLCHMLGAALRSGLPPRTWIDAVRGAKYEEWGGVCESEGTSYSLNAG